MTGKIIDRETNGFLLIIIPLAAAVVVIFSAWQWILLLLIASLGLKVWQDYRWSQLSARINPIFARLMQEYQGCITPLDLCLKTGLKQKTATEFLERKAGEFGAQKKTIANKGTVYYFITASTLGLILDDSEPEMEETEVKSLPSSPTVSFAKEEIPAPASETVDTKEEIPAPAPETVDTKEEIPTSAPETVDTKEEIPTSAPETVDTQEEISTSAPETVTVETEKETEVKQDTVADVTDSQKEQVSAEVVSQADVTAENTQLEVEDKPAPVTNLGQLLKEVDSQKSGKLEPPSPPETSDTVMSIGTLNQAELAKRLEVSTSTIGKRKKGMDFAEWSRIKDPEGIAWRYNPKDDNFGPIQDK